MTELIERLRGFNGFAAGAICREAADRIEALEAALREADDRIEKAVGVLREQPGYTVKSIADAFALLSRSGNGEGT
jgi:hypothetical protein